MPDKEPAPTSGNTQPQARAQVLVRVTAGAVVFLQLSEYDTGGRLLSQVYLTPKAVSGDTMLQASAIVNVGSNCKLQWQLFYREKGWRIDKITERRNAVTTHDLTSVRNPYPFTPYTNATVCFVFTCSKGGAS